MAKSRKANSMMRRRTLFAAAVLGAGAFLIVAGGPLFLSGVEY